MFLDFTKNIRLERELYKKYVVARVVLYLTFLVGVLFVAHKILFPTLYLNFDFNNIGSLKNTLVSPRIFNSRFPEKGDVSAKEKLTFNANPVGNFSDVEIALTTDKSSANIKDATVILRKSYMSFFYPDGEPIGFRDGTLLNNIKDDSYYIVSGGALRKFSSFNVASELGYSKNSFLPVSPEDLSYNRFGEDVADASAYPDGALFAVDDTYYQMKDKKLSAFVSARAFLSQYEISQAITKNSDLLSTFEVSETRIGFADGTLASFDVSAFILSANKKYPIINPETFIGMGFNWDDIVALDSEEIGIYEKQKTFTRNYPHPDGTLFSDQKTGEYFIIENGKKRPIKSQAVKKTYFQQKPVIANLEESEKEFSCILKKEIFGRGDFSCTIPLDEVETFLGNDYQIDMKFENNIKIDTINTTFFTDPNWQNMRLSLANIKNRLVANYMPAEQQQ